jgi:hypothetical protein
MLSEFILEIPYPAAAEPLRLVERLKVRRRVSPARSTMIRIVVQSGKKDHAKSGVCAPI